MSSLAQPLLCGLRRFQAEGRRREDLPFFHWSMQHALSQIQGGFDGLFENLRVPGLTWLFRGPIAAWSRLNRLAGSPSDELGARVARALQVPGEQRDRLTRSIYVPADRQSAVGRLEHAFVLAYQAEDVVKKLKRAIKSRQLPKAHPLELVDDAVDLGLITGDDRELLKLAEAARDDAVQVDSFTLEEYMQSAVLPADETRSTPVDAGAEPVLV